MSTIITSLVNLIGETNPEFTDLQLKKMEYGLVCFSNEITKLVPYFIIFYFFGVHKYFLVSLVFLSSLRLYTGGYHAKTYWGCFFISFIIFVIIIIIGRNIAFSYVYAAILLGASCILVCIFSPVDNENKRILSNERRLRLKYISIMIIALLSIIVFIIPPTYKVTALTSIITAVLMMLFGLLVNKF